MTDKKIPMNLLRLNDEEQSLRLEALSIIEKDPKSLLHLRIIERAMTVTKLVINYSQNDEDYKVIRMLSIRLFNAFAASQKLMFSGYHQNSGIIMRDILETLFLMDLFRRDYSLVEQWRFADKKMRRKVFSPTAVRKKLDDLDGFKTRKREEKYKMFCDLAAHPNMHSQHMLKMEDGYIVGGPFMEQSTLYAGLSELATLSVQVGEIVDFFLPDGNDPDSVRLDFKEIKEKWVKTFYKGRHSYTGA